MLVLFGERFTMQTIQIRIDPVNTYLNWFLLVPKKTRISAGLFWGNGLENFELREYYAANYGVGP